MILLIAFVDHWLTAFSVVRRPPAAAEAEGRPAAATLLRAEAEVAEHPPWAAEVGHREVATELLPSVAAAERRGAVAADDRRIPSGRRHVKRSGRG